MNDSLLSIILIQNFGKSISIIALTIAFFIILFNNQTTINQKEKIKKYVMLSSILIVNTINIVMIYNNAHNYLVNTQWRENNTYISDDQTTTIVFTEEDFFKFEDQSEITFIEYSDYIILGDNVVKFVSAKNRYTIEYDTQHNTLSLINRNSEQKNEITLYAQ